MSFNPADILKVGSMIMNPGTALQLGGEIWRNDQQRKENTKNREFQERMSNTAWQRGVADMRAAGVNPMLSISEGPASSPSGSTFEVKSPTAGMTSSAVEVQRIKKDLQLADSQMKVNESSVAKNMADAALSNAKATPTRTMSDLIGGVREVLGGLPAATRDKLKQKFNLMGPSLDIINKYGEELENESIDWFNVGDLRKNSRKGRE